jgi:hypothetical protein
MSRRLPLIWIKLARRRDGASTINSVKIDTASSLVPTGDLPLHTEPDVCRAQLDLS